MKIWGRKFINFAEIGGKFKKFVEIGGVECNMYHWLMGRWTPLPVVNPTLPQILNCDPNQLVFTYSQGLHHIS